MVCRSLELRAALDPAAARMMFFDVLRQKLKWGER